MGGKRRVRLDDDANVHDAELLLRCVPLLFSNTNTNTNNARLYSGDFNGCVLTT